MTYTSMILSFLVLVLALVLGLFPRMKWWMFPLAIATFFGATYLSNHSGVVMAIVSLLMLGGMLLHVRKWRYRTFAMFAVGSFTAVYALAFFAAYAEVNHYRELREGVTMEPLANRLPPVRRSSGEQNLTNETNHLLISLNFRSPGNDRSVALAGLHARTMETFVKSPGNGFERRPISPSENTIGIPEMAEPIRQPDPFSDLQEFEVSPATTTKTPGKALADLHLNGIVDFVNPLGFGYVTNDKQLFGFQPHHFRKLPRTDGWKVRSIELVSLLMHEDPRIYASTDLPRMDKIRTVPTRSLDRFETAGLAELKAGDDFFANETATGVRMLGAIRSIHECIKCHGGERGDLLGAFSYVLKNEGASR